MKKEKKKERKKPHIQTKIYHTFVNGRYGDKLLTKEERDEILYPLGKYEHKGKGLPEIRQEGNCPLHIFSFDICMSHKEEGIIELAYALKSSKTHTIMPFEGLPGKKSCNAKGDFERNLHRMIKDTCFILADACVKNQTEDLEKKREFLENVIEHFSYKYKELLGLGHYKIIEESENEDGMRVEKAVFIDYGARPQSKEELEKEKRDFVCDLYEALKKFKQSHSYKPKQKDLMPYMFNRHSDKEKKISEMLDKHNLDFKKLWLIFNATNDQEDFVSNVIRIFRVAPKKN